MTTQPYRSAVTSARDGFGQLLRAEWTKLRSVRSTAWCLLLGAGLMLLVSMLGVQSQTTTVGTGPNRVDRFHFVHQPLSGDASITARVLTQEPTGPSARAGIMIKASTEPGAPYASIAVTPGRGVQMQANFEPDLAGAAAAAPVWLRLTRTGTSVTGYESTDGRTWHEVGTVTVAALPATAQVGLFVTSPSTALRVVRQGGSTSSGPAFDPSTATFDSVTVDPASSASNAPWSNLDVGGPPGEQMDGTPAAGSAAVSGGTFTVAGAGDIGTLAPGGDNDIVKDSLAGILVAMIAIVVLGVVFVTSEYAKGVIRTTFTVSPRRGRVLAAKAVVLGLVVFLVGLVTALAALALTRPIQRRNGFVAPSYPDPSLADPTVLRAVIGTALFLAVLALFALGVGTAVRRAAGAVTLVLALVLVPSIIGAFIPVGAELWLNRTTPLAGLAMQQTRDRFDTPIGPWAGLGVLCAWAVVALAVASWQLRRRDA